MKEQQFYVYWYHLPSHTNKETQGYIGITYDLKRRHRQHKCTTNPKNKSYKDTHFARAINKYGGFGNLIKETLLKGTFEEVCAEENRLRPKCSIGWNIAEGGEHPGASSPLKGRKGTPSIYKDCTNRWTETQRSAIGSAHKGKTLSKEHIEILRTKNRASKSLGTKISLFHKDFYTILHTFHSISEASRQLNLPLARLKSKNQRKSTSYGEDGWAVLFNKDFDRSQTLTGRQLAGQRCSATKQRK